MICIFGPAFAEKWAMPPVTLKRQKDLMPQNSTKNLARLVNLLFNCHLENIVSKFIGLNHEYSQERGADIEDNVPFEKLDDMDLYRNYKWNIRSTLDMSSIE